MKQILLSITAVVLLILLALFLPGGGRSKNDSASVNNVSIVEGVQIIEINARGGYSPRKTLAKAGIPTIIKVKTNGSFDCSVALVIPSEGYRKNLEISGEENIDIGIKEKGEVLNGLCSMGMYGFQVYFE